MKDIEIGQELYVSYGNRRLWLHDVDARVIAAADDEMTAVNGLDRTETF